MWGLIDKIFKRSGTVKHKNNLLKYLKAASKLSHTINTKKEELEDTSYKVVTESRDEYFISFNNFLLLLEEEDMNIESIISSCTHISDINKKNFSTVEVYPVAEEDHIALYSDKEICKNKTGYNGDSILLVTWRKV